MRKLNRIIVHCSATKPGWWAKKGVQAKVNEIRRWHVRGNGWSDIGYHYVIDRSGKWANGRPLEKVGAHTKGHNTGSIGICLIGGHGSSETDRFEDHFTPQQEETLRWMLDDLQEKYGKMSIHGHNEYAAKACPGFQVSRWLKRKPPAAPIDERKGEATVGGGVAAGAVAGGVAISQAGWSDWVWAALVVAGVIGLGYFLWSRRK